MSPDPAWLRTTAQQVLAHALGRPPALAGTRLVCVDGPAGSGKTTLATAVADLAAESSTVRVVHLDDVYEGWDGLDDALDRVAREVVAPLRSGRPGRYRRYDWHARRLAETHVVEPVDVLVLEGVGSGGSAYADAISTLVWVEAPAAVRLRRGLARDGEDLRDEWLAWMAREAQVHDRERTRERADIVVDGAGSRS